MMRQNKDVLTAIQRDKNVFLRIWERIRKNPPGGCEGAS